MAEDIAGIIAVSIPIFVCVVLPTMVVWIKSRKQMNTDNQRAQVLIEAIKANPEIDPERLAEILQPQETPKQPKNSAERNLTIGLVSTMLGLAIGGFFLYLEHTGNSGYNLFLLGSMCLLAVGISFLIVYFVGKSKSRKG